MDSSLHPSFRGYFKRWFVFENQILTRVICEFSQMVICAGQRQWSSIPQINMSKNNYSVCVSRWSHEPGTLRINNSMQANRHLMYIASINMLLFPLYTYLHLPGHLAIYWSFECSTNQHHIWFNLASCKHCCWNVKHCIQSMIIGLVAASNCVRMPHSRC